MLQDCSPAEQLGLRASGVQLPLPHLQVLVLLLGRCQQQAGRVLQPCSYRGQTRQFGPNHPVKTPLVLTAQGSSRAHLVTRIACG